MNALTAIDFDQWGDDELEHERNRILEEIARLARVGHTYESLAIQRRMEDLRPVTLQIAGRENRAGMAAALQELTDAGVSYDRALVMMNVD